MTNQADANAQDSGRRTVLPTAFLLFGALFLAGVMWGICDSLVNAESDQINLHRTPTAFLIVFLSYFLAALWEFMAVVALVVRAIRGTRPTRADLVVVVLVFVLLTAVLVPGILVS